MWVRTTLTIKRWTEDVERKPEPDACVWEENGSDISRLPSWERGHLLAGVASSTDTSIFSSEGEFKDTERCCWKHKQCSGHLLHPFSTDYCHCNLHLHAITNCDCDSRLKDCSEKSNSSCRDVGPTCSRDMESTCFNIIQPPCFEIIPEEECVERFWYGWCKSYRPVSVAVIHHPLHYECGAEEDEEEEEEEGDEERKPRNCTQKAATTTATDTGMPRSPGTCGPDSAAPITIWRSESPTGKSQGSKIVKKVKKKKEKEKEEEESDEKAKLKKKAKNKLTKKKSPVKSESSPQELNRSLSPRELTRMSESSPDSREELESEDSYNGQRREEGSSEDMADSSSPRKKDKNTAQAKKPVAKTSPIKKANKRKSPPGSNPNLS